MNPSSHLRIETIEGAVVAHFKVGRLIDETIIRETGRELEELAAKTSGALVLDLANVEMLSSTMLGKLITVEKLLEERGAKVALCRVPEKICELLKVVKLDQYFPVYADVPSALAALK
jgi:anti-anti-sigma factor